MDSWMYKIIVISILVIFLLVLFGGVIACYPQIVGNKSWLDTKFEFTKAYIDLGDKTIEVEIDRWLDYEGEQIQIIAKDGSVYLVSSFNTILVNEK